MAVKKEKKKSRVSSLSLTLVACMNEWCNKTRTFGLSDDAAVCGAGFASGAGEADGVPGK